MSPHAYFPILFLNALSRSFVEGYSDSTLSPFPQQSVRADLTASWSGCNGWWSSCYETLHSWVHAAPEGPPVQHPQHRPWGDPHTSSRPWAAPARPTLPIKCRVIPHPQRSSTLWPVGLLQSSDRRLPTSRSSPERTGEMNHFLSPCSQVTSLASISSSVTLPFICLCGFFSWWETVPMSYSFLGSLELNTTQCKFLKF